MVEGNGLARNSTLHYFHKLDGYVTEKKDLRNTCMCASLSKKPKVPVSMKREETQDNLSTKLDRAAALSRERDGTMCASPHSLTIIQRDCFFLPLPCEC